MSTPVGLQSYFEPLSYFSVDPRDPNSSWSTTAPGGIVPEYVDPDERPQDAPWRRSDASTPWTYTCHYDPYSGRCQVVNVPGSSPTTAAVPQGELRFATEGLRKAYAASYRIEGKTGLGSGVGVMSVQRDDGKYMNLIITNRHVVSDENTGKTEESLVVKSHMTGESFKGTLVAVLPQSGPDMAALAVVTDYPLSTIEVADSSQLAFGQRVYAIGNPLGLFGAVTAGIISHPDRTGMFGPEYSGRIIQFDAAISPGNSGGPLITQDGQLIALTTFTVPGRNNNSQNLNFGYAADEGLEQLLAKIRERSELNS